MPSLYKYTIEDWLTQNSNKDVIHDQSVWSVNKYI